MCDVIVFLCFCAVFLLLLFLLLSDEYRTLENMNVIAVSIRVSSNQVVCCYRAHNDDGIERIHCHMNLLIENERAHAHDTIAPIRSH